MKWVITGGSGFVGSNTALKLLELGHEVIIIDKKFPKINSLMKFWPGSCSISTPDCYPFLHQNVKECDVFLHCAAQTAVTKSIEDPVYDANVNIKGTLNCLDFLVDRKIRGTDGQKPLFIYMSTNKVYGSFSYFNFKELQKRYYVSADFAPRTTFPIPETPYGISKYSGELYCKEFSRLHDMTCVTLRCSCIYGPNQNGSFDQGWIDHMVSSAVAWKSINVCGDGKQVRDILHVDDLIDLYIRMSKIHKRHPGHINKFSVMDIGGGLGNDISILELLDYLRVDHGLDFKVTFSDWRSGDQKYYVSNITPASVLFDWKPKVSALEGIDRMVADKRAKLAQHVSP